MPPSEAAAGPSAAAPEGGLSVAVAGDGMGAKLKLAGFDHAAWTAAYGGPGGPARLRAWLESRGLTREGIQDDRLRWVCETLAASTEATRVQDLQAVEGAEVAKGTAPAHEEPQAMMFHRQYLSNAEAVGEIRRKADTWGMATIKESIDPNYWVTPGEIVLSFQGAAPGRVGRDVRGAVVPFQLVRDRLPPFGKTLAMRRNTLIAACEGALILEGELKVLGADSLPACHVAVSDDAMTADLVVAAGALNDWTVTLDMVRAALKEQDVNCMLPEPEIRAALERFNRDRLPLSLQVARGRPPVPGSEGAVEILVDPEPEAPEPGPDGSIDFKSFSFFRTVDKGRRLAQIKPPVPGEAGTDVRGKPVPPPKAPAFVMELGKNTARAETEPNIIEASRSGRLTVRNGMPEVVEVLEVAGDVSLKTGNVAFPGAVKVAGDVHNRMRIEAVGDVEVVGAVEDSFIHSDGAIVVRGGVNGAGGGLIKSRLSSVTIGYLHNQRIESASGIVVYNEIISSTLLARKTIAMRFGRYSVLGGHLLAGDSMDLFNVGAESGVKTILEVGKDFEVEGEMRGRQGRLAEHTADLDFLRDMEEQLSRILRLRRRADEDLLLHKRVQGALEILDRWIAALKAELTDLALRLHAPGPCEILIRGVIHAGTVIRWRDNVLVVPGPLQNRKWIFRAGSPVPPAEGRPAG